MKYFSRRQKNVLKEKQECVIINRGAIVSYRSTLYLQSAFLLQQFSSDKARERVKEGER